MIISQTEVAIPNAHNVIVSESALTVELEDGRTVVAPLGWYPRLANASPEERGRWRLIGAGIGIHWKYLDEDFSAPDRGAHVEMGVVASSWLSQIVTPDAHPAV